MKAVHHHTGLRLVRHGFALARIAQRSGTFSASLLVMKIIGHRLAPHIGSISNGCGAPRGFAQMILVAHQCVTP
ncbi:hypothetical protein [Bradyrhizobium stylosanthis]|uniref:Uncharacterized protein n=1 Tax=Bradyrhizobium stylosanthis TaxID=1803665 RepID=A0A560D4J2_9BRAD|nr:hypothetical protein [Bradyrhizobium stylosanthis]TWA92035.1 hypothetical protein FBZ96_11241 [Bradyrhizobium stylosanthis]